MTDDAFLPYGRQWIDDDDVAAVTRALRSDYLTTGPEVPAFERAFAETVGARHGVACANGTAALHLACMALGLGPGDDVVVPSVTFLATANAPSFCGAHVRFADVDPETGLMRPEDVEQAMARGGRTRVRAVFAVHIAGRPVDMPGIVAAATSVDDIPVIEDACHGLGTTWTDTDGTVRRIGDCSHGAASTWSFHPVKTIACGEGGMITTNDDRLAEHMARARSHGMVRDPDGFTLGDMAFDGDAPNPWFYEMPEPGYNYRLSDVQAALGRSQLAKLSHFADRRRALVARYRQALAPLAPQVRIPNDPPHSDPVHHLMVALIDFEGLSVTRRQVMERLRARRVGSQVHYIPVHRQPYYRAINPALSLQGADAYYARCLALPLFPAMADTDVDRVAEALSEAIGGGA